MASSSNHSPIVLNTDGEQGQGKKPFKFVEAWTKDETSLFVVENAWKKGFNGNPIFKVCKKIKEMKEDLRRWNRDWFRNIQTKIKEKCDRLDQIQKEEPISENLEKEVNTNLELHEWLIRKGSLWKQKSRTKWLPATDLNTKFFHLSTIVRRGRNAIDFLKNQQGSWISGREDIGKCFVEFFTGLFTSSSPSIPNNLDGLISPSLSQDDIEMLTKIPTADEIKKVVFSIGSNKAPGPDGMLALLFKFY